MRFFYLPKEAYNIIQRFKPFDLNENKKKTHPFYASHLRLRLNNPTMKMHYDQFQSWLGTCDVLSVSIEIECGFQMNRSAARNIIIPVR